MVYLIVVLLIIGMIAARLNKPHYQALNKMDGFEFEKYVTRLYNKMGYKAHTTKASGDFGADVIAVKGKEKLCIQCKRYTGVVGIEAVQQAIASLGYYKGTRAVVVTNSTYTNAAQILAKKSNAQLIDGYQLNKLINKYMADRNIKE